MLLSFPPRAIEILSLPERWGTGIILICKYIVFYPGMDLEGFVPRFPVKIFSYFFTESGIPLYPTAFLGALRRALRESAASRSASFMPARLFLTVSIMKILLRVKLKDNGWQEVHLLCSGQKNSNNLRLPSSFPSAFIRSNSFVTNSSGNAPLRQVCELSSSA